MTIMLKVDGPGKGAKQISQAAAILRNGGIVVFPTETVYGIGADALNPDACRKIYRIKGRAADNPLIVHVSSMEMAERVAVIPEKYDRLMRRVWPAPLTIIVKAKAIVPKVVTGGLDTIAIRMPDNEVALSLIRESGVPIAAPSANISMKPSSTSASHARKYFYGKVDAIIDSGSSKFGLESTVIDLGKFTLLRPGAYTVEQAQKAFGKKLKVTPQSRAISDSRSKPSSPGMKYRHYSPDKPIFLFTGDPRTLPAASGSFRGEFTFIGSSESCRIMEGISKTSIALGSRGDPRHMASMLFAALIALDEEKTRFAIIEGFLEKGIGLAMMNRIRKACAHKYFSDERGLSRRVREIS
ncbi:MAG: L-threonylcarbamoyladenylate synthase [Candidatus Micrarchaeaceae archaeon]